MSGRRLRIGVAGLGRAFTLMLPTFSADPRVELVAAADARPDARQRFASDFGARTYDTVEALARDAGTDVIYVATPHGLHAAHTEMAAAGGKHVLVEKPMAISLAECDRMIAACVAAKVHLIVGHSHSFDRPVLEARRLIAQGTLGRLRMITALNFTDFLYRPRRPEELVTEAGGGVVFSQAAHQVDIVRYLAGTRAVAVRAHTGSWDRLRPTEGAYSALLRFEDGAFASLVYSGYGHFDSDEFCGWVGELGVPKDPEQYGAARRRLAGIPPGTTEDEFKAAASYGSNAAATVAAQPRTHQHFGTIVACCERGDVRPLPDRIITYDDGERIVHALAPPRIPRVEVIDELYDAVVGGQPPLHDGPWSKATLEICLALLDSARTGRDVELSHQVALPRGR